MSCSSVSGVRLSSMWVLYERVMVDVPSSSSLESSSSDISESESSSTIAFDLILRGERCLRLLGLNLPYAKVSLSLLVSCSKTRMGYEHDHTTINSDFDVIPAHILSYGNAFVHLVMIPMVMLKKLPTIHKLRSDLLLLWMKAEGKGIK